jgi:hypothetical protein
MGLSELGQGLGQFHILRQVDQNGDSGGSSGPLVPDSIVIGPTASPSYDEPVAPPAPTEAPAPQVEA